MPVVRIAVDERNRTDERPDERSDAQVGAAVDLQPVVCLASKTYSNSATNSEGMLHGVSRADLLIYGGVAVNFCAVLVARARTTSQLVEPAS